MISSLLMALVSSIFIWLTYRYTRKLSVDNFSVHLIFAVYPSFLLQATGFVFFDLKGRVIDTVPILDYESQMPLGAIVLLIFSLIGCASVLFFSKRSRNAVLLKEDLKYNRLLLLAMIFSALVILGLQLFASSVGTNIALLFAGSSKWLVATDSGAVGFESNGYARFLTSLGTPVFLFYVAYFIYYDVRLNWKKSIVIGLLFLVAVVPPALLSSRGAALSLFISIFFMLLIKRRLKIKFIILGGSAALLLFSALSVARNDFEGEIGILDAVESRAFYGGGISLFNTSIIVNEYLNDGSEHYYGASYLGLLTSPVPRSLWPEKPVIAYDQLIARKIYRIGGDGAQAIPAGLVGESIMNFGIYLAGFFIFFCFSIAIWIHNWIITKLPLFFSFLIRCIVFPKFAAKLLASGVGFAVMDAVLILVGVIVIYMVSVKRRRENG